MDGGLRVRAVQACGPDRILAEVTESPDLASSQLPDPSPLPSGGGAFFVSDRVKQADMQPLDLDGIPRFVRVDAIPQ